MYQNLMLEKERRESTLSSEIHALSTQLNMFSRERENLFKVIQSSPNPNEMATNFQRLKDEMEEKLKTNEIFISKLQSENADLKKKLSTEESNKNKLSDLVKKKNDNIEYMKNEVEKYKTIFEDCKKEVKWNQNTVLQKENDLRVYGEKIKKLTEENNSLTKKYEKLKASKGVTENVEENNNQVKQKPFLFGPETDEC
jgi:chromosome segregation ATPase